MKTRRLIAPLSLVLAFAAARLPAQDAPPPPSNTIHSQRTVQIIWEADAPPPNITGLLERLLSDEAVAPVVQRVLGAEPKKDFKYAWDAGKVTVSGNSYTVGISASVDFDKGDRPAAKELADALVKRLSELLRDERTQEARTRYDRVREEVREVEFELEVTRRRVREKAAKLLDSASRADVSVATLEAGIGKLEDERQRIELDLAGMAARLEAVQEQFAEASERAAKDAAADPVIPELEKAVAARQQLLELTRTQVGMGQAPADSVPRAEAELIEARVQLLDRRGDAGARGGEALAPLRREIQSLTIDIRDRKARLAYAEKRLQSLRNAAQEFQELRWMEEREAGLRRLWEEANVRLRKTARHVESVPADRVIVTESYHDVPVPNKEAR